MSGDSGLEGLVAVNAYSVTDCLNSSEGPTAAAIALVSDFFNGVALRPGSSGVELGGNIGKRSDFLLRQKHLLGCLESTHQSLDLFNSLAIEVVVVTTYPKRLQTVYLFNDGFLVEELHTADSQSQKC